MRSCLKYVHQTATRQNHYFQVVQDFRRTPGGSIFNRRRHTTHRTPISRVKREDCRPVAQGDALIRRSLQSEVGRRSTRREGCGRSSYLVRLVFFHATTSALVLCNLDASTTIFSIAKRCEKFGRFAGNKSVKVLLISAPLLKASPADAGLSAEETIDPVRRVAFASSVDLTRRYFLSTGRDGRF